MTMTIINQSNQRIPRNFLQENIHHLWCSQILKSLRAKEKTQEMALVFVTDPQMRNLNYKYRNKRKTTDVLSFPSSQPSYLGDIVICVPVAQQQAKQNATSLRNELLRLVIHGITHLLGFDHEASARKATEFFALEKKILSISLPPM